MSSTPTNLRRQLIKLGFKVFLVGGLFYLLAKKGLISIEQTKRALSQWDQSLPAMLALFLISFLGVIRWHWLLHAQNIPLKWTRTIQLHFIGQFFNIALPGAVTGDLVKAFYIAKEAPGKRGHAFGSILFDRVAGVSALVLVSAGALVWGYTHLTTLFKALEVLVISAAVGVICFYGYLFLVKEHHDPLWLSLKALENKFKRAGSFRRIYEGMRHYHTQRWAVLKVVLLSVLIHITVCWACLSFAHALGDWNIDPTSVFVVVPLGLLVTAIPILPAGIGTGHAAFGWLFLLLGSQRGADVFSLFALMQFFGGTIGGVVYLRFRSHEPSPGIGQLTTAAETESESEFAKNQ